MKIIKTVTGIGQDVVLINGALATSDDLQIVANELSPYFRVTNINSPGNGKSAWVESIKTIHDIADILLPELPENAIYIGFSKGGLTAQSIAARYPNRVKHIIGVGTTPKFIANNNWIGFPEPGFEKIIMPIVKDAHVDKFVRGAYENEFANINPKPPLYYEALKICDSRPDIPTPIIQKIIQIVDETDLREEFKQISCPIDLIIGDQDSCVPNQSFAHIKALNTRTNIHEIRGAQHAIPYLTHPHEFNSILHSILGNIKL